MKKNFKKFLDEDITINGNSLQITVSHDPTTSTKDRISTFIRKQPYTTTIKGISVKIFSLLNYVSSDDVTKMLTSIKGKGPYDVNNKQLSFLMKQLHDGTDKIFKQIRPDVIIYPKSSSQFLKQYIDSIRDIDTSIKIIDDAFLKKQLDSSNIEPLINTSHPDWEKFSTENPKEVVKLKRSIASNIDNGIIELKKLYKPYLKFIKNFIEMRDAYEVLDSVLDKKIVVIDDILSSGATMAEMIRQVEELEPLEIYGLTVFKHTTSQK